MKEKACNLHKRMAMGDTIKGYAKGGSIGVNVSVPSPVGGGKMVPKVGGSGRALSPTTVAKRNNGIKGA